MRTKETIDIIKSTLIDGPSILIDKINESVSRHEDKYFIKDVKYKEQANTMVVIIIYSSLDIFKDEYINSATRAGNKVINNQDEALDQSTEMLKRVFNREVKNGN